MPDDLFALVVYLADGLPPTVQRGLTRTQVQVLRYTIEQSVQGIWPDASRDCLGRPALVIGGELIIAAHITRVAVLPDAALDMPVEQRPAKVGFELFPATGPR